MNQRFDFGPQDADKIVYVRPVAVKELPRELQEQVGHAATIFAVHNSSGERLALVKDRRLAFSLARQNDLAPVHVH